MSHSAYRNPGPQLSGATYVSARERIDAPTHGYAKIKIRDPRVCDHVETICATVSCVESWSIDWQLFFDRTQGGRQLATQVSPDS